MKCRVPIILTCRVYNSFVFNASVACKVVFKLPYKVKYRQGVNFGDWRFLDKIANILSTNNNYIIESICDFLTSHYNWKIMWHCCSV